jgi:hypothetical protein
LSISEEDKAEVAARLAFTSDRVLQEIFDTDAIGEAVQRAGGVN